MVMKRGVARLRRIVLACIAVTALAAVPMTVSTTPAQAAVVGFNPGNIISDSLFYNGSAMSASEVQSFLNQRVPRCTIGDPGRTAGMVWGTTNIAPNCLRDYRMNTVSRAANPYCGAYVGVAGETAAQIIAKVGQACGISQKVLLITLEKEQSLVTDSWPTVRQIDVATGYACPDSGPNWSANCNPEYYGFQNQVYYAAWQLKVYKAFPNSYNYKPFQYNTIQYNPNPACGTSQVYIENWATAALYIYTPYRPNQAALDAGWGTGDACSSYGNRNFYNFYTTWFGSSSGFTVSGDIGAYWNARGAENSAFGLPTGPSAFRSTGFPGGLWLQTFSGGVITTEMNTGKTVGVPYGRVYDHWNLQMGGIYGALGAPVSEAAEYAANGGGVLQWFQGGLVISATTQGKTASLPYGKVYDLYNNVADGIYGALGYPLSGFDSYAGGQLQNFQGGIIAQATGAVAPVYASGTFYDHYNGVAGGIYGRLGFPLSNEVTLENGTRQQEFKNGYLVRTVNGPVTEISGEMLAPYRQAEKSGDPLGAPVSGKVSLALDGGAELIQFENGVIISERRTGKTSAVVGAMFAHYNGVLGGVYGDLGYSVGSSATYTVNGGGSVQLFRNGLLLASQQAGSVAGMLFDSPVYARYNGVEGGIYGWLGYPVADEVTQPDGSRSQEFQNGVIAVAGSGAVTVLPTAAFELYQIRGGASGPLGRQTQNSQYYATGSGAWLSFFEGGLITQESRSGVAATLRYADPLYQYYNGHARGIYGALGYPLGEAHTDGSGAAAQLYQGGVLRRAPGGAVFVFTESTWNKYLAVAAENGVLGAPTSGPQGYSANGGGTLQFFRNGLITTENRTGQTVALPYGPIYDYYNDVAGGIYGSLGYPISDQVTSAGVTTQQFQNGLLSDAGGVVTRR